MCKEPKVDYEAAMTLQNNENINLNIDRSRIIKIRRSYTPILDIVKKPLSFMHYWNLDSLLKMTHMDMKLFQQLLKDQFMVQSQEKQVEFPHELESLWLYQRHWAPLAWVFIYTMCTFHALHMKHCDLSTSYILLHVFINSTQLCIMIIMVIRM